jgi:NADH:ubiquinone oxidoreductase subunit F (NADH-binding)
MRNPGIVVAVMMLIATFSASSQILEQGILQRTGTFASQGGAYYNFSGGTGCDFKISVWGQVNNPGRYNIPCETNLLEMLSFCGGARRGALLDQVKIIRKGGVDEQMQIDSVFIVDLNKYLKESTEKTDIRALMLMPGDLIVIPGEDPLIVDPWLRVSQFVVAIANVITATIAVLNYMQK